MIEVIKRILLTITLLFTTQLLCITQVFADVTHLAIYTPRTQLQVMCDELKEFSDTTMRYHQNNVPIEMLLMVVNNEHVISDEDEINTETQRQIAMLFGKIIVDAYKYPIYLKHEDKLKAVKQYSDGVYNTCIGESYL